MGNRGTKSILLVEYDQFLDLYPSKNIVKAQRVDGSWELKKRKNKNKQNKFDSLRCTLMVFERNYQVKIHTKQSTLSNLLKIITKKLNNRVMVMSR